MSVAIFGARLKVRVDPPATPTDAVQYIGYAQPNTSESDAEWAILRITTVGTDLSEVNWANGSNLFKFAWSLRATYTYT